VAGTARAEDHHGQHQDRVQVAKAHGCHLLMVPWTAAGEAGSRPWGGPPVVAVEARRRRKQGKQSTAASMPRLASAATLATGQKVIFRPPACGPLGSCDGQRPRALDSFDGGGGQIARGAAEPEKTFDGRRKHSSLSKGNTQTARA
jgi:hypothetical protein